MGEDRRSAPAPRRDAWGGVFRWSSPRMMWVIPCRCRRPRPRACRSACRRPEEHHVVELGVLERSVPCPRSWFTVSPSRVLEADDRFEGPLGLPRIAVAPGASIADRPLLGPGPRPHGLELVRRAPAAIGRPCSSSAGRRWWRSDAARLTGRSRQSSQAEPGEPVDDPLDRRSSSAAVGILDAQAEHRHDAGEEQLKRACGHRRCLIARRRGREHYD